MAKLRYLAVAVFMLASVSVGATVWQPTNEDTDFLQFDASGLSTNGGSLAFFDAGDFGGAALVIGSIGGQVVFTDLNAMSDPGNFDWEAELFIGNVSQGTLMLGDSTSFELGMDWGLGYVTDYGFTQDSGSSDTYNIEFRGLLEGGEGVRGNTTAVDVKVVPVPAAVWLFGTGLLGLVGVARRRV